MSSQHQSSLFFALSSYSSESNLFSCMIIKLVQECMTGVCNTINSLQMERKLFNKVQGADAFILSYFVVTYVLLSAQLDKFEGPWSSIKLVLRCLNSDFSFGVYRDIMTAWAHTIFFTALTLIPESHRPLLLVEYLSINSGWAAPLVWAMSTCLREESGCPPTMAVARTIISVHEMVGCVGPT